jgi:hypothetical protein
MADADDFAANLADLDREIANLEHLSLLARENRFEALTERISKDLADARLWRSKFVAAIHSAS